MQIKLSNLKIILFEILLISLAMGLLYQVSNNNNQLYNEENNKLSMLKAANRLRQSSDDLTHFARTYAVTGDKKFEKQYFDTLAIRNGEKLRPLNYHSIYWDLDEKTRKINHKETVKISLDDIFKSLPCDQKEIKKLELAKFNSDDLVNLEIEAFNAMDGKFKNKEKKYTIKGKPNQELAIKLLHSKEYYQAKHKIMQPIDEFILMLDKRTTHSISNIHSKTTPLLLLLSFTILIFIIGNYLIFKFLNNQEKIKHEEKNVLLAKQKELNAQLVEKSEIAQKLNRELEESEYELQTINENLEQTIKDEIEKNNIIQKQLFKSEKMASMGEMIGNIAHQWRQPLSVISTGVTGMQIQKEYGMLADDQFNTTCNSINDNAQFLSKTIDDFTNYIKGDNKKEIFILKENIDSFLHLLDSSIKNHNINIVLDLEEEIKINGFSNSLTQCFINIFNNAKDALIQNNIEDKFIFISTSVVENRVVIKIKDNGGGIPENIRPKIFEPYFTTKHQSQGTGLGLHMTYNFIVSEMRGTIEVNNTSYIYQDKKFKGAEFIIKLEADN